MRSTVSFDTLPTRATAFTPMPSVRAERIIARISRGSFRMRCGRSDKGASMQPDSMKMLARAGIHDTIRAMQTDHPTPKDSDRPEEPKISASDAARALSKRGASKGGRARAEALGDAEKQKIAKAAAEARWSLPKAFMEAPLQIGEVTFQAAVLEDRKTRVLSEKSFMETMGMYYSGWISTNREQSEDGAAVLPLYLSFEKLKPFISKHLKPADLQPFKYLSSNGRAVAHGIEAETVPKICRVWVDAAAAGGLGKRQLQIAEKAAVLLAGLEKVGITALIDEATGFQRFREGNALATILEAFIAKELAEWVITFESWYYDGIYRLKGWKRKPDSPPQARTQLFGKITNDIVYDRLAPGVREELQRITPRDKKGRLMNHLHRSLTRNHGYQALKAHLSVLEALMRITPDGQWNVFMEHVNKAKPKFGSTALLDFNAR